MTEIPDICCFTHREHGISLSAISLLGLGPFLRVKLIQVGFQDQIVCWCQPEVDVSASVWQSD